MKPDKIFIYFHGYGSNCDTPKVQQLKSAFPKDTVHAFNIDVDPRISIPHLQKCIDNILLTDPNSDEKLVLVGTSLGAWYASRIGKLYAARRIMINPAMSPSTSLKRYGVSDEICSQYDELVDADGTYILAEGDEVFDSLQTLNEVESIGGKVLMVPGHDHRFAGQIFIDSVKKILNF